MLIKKRRKKVKSVAKKSKKCLENLSLPERVDKILKTSNINPPTTPPAIKTINKIG